MVEEAFEDDIVMPTIARWLSLSTPALITLWVRSKHSESSAIFMLRIAPGGSRVGLHVKSAGNNTVRRAPSGLVCLFRESGTLVTLGSLFQLGSVFIHPSSCFLEGPISIHVPRCQMDQGAKYTQPPCESGSRSVW
jgi:hypothetical protein